MQSAEMSALKMLRSGFFYLFVAMIMLIAFVEFAPTMFIYISSSAGIMEMIIFFTLLLLAIVVIFLYAIFEKIRYGMRQLSEVDSRFRICYTGTTLILVGLAILTLGTAIVVALSVEYTVLRSLVLVVEVLLIGGINAFIGYVLTFVVGAFKLHGKYRNPPIHGDRHPLCLRHIFALHRRTTLAGRCLHNAHRAEHHRCGLCPNVHRPRRHDKEAEHAELTPATAKNKVFTV
jgi:hypothetical protein